MKDLLWVHGLVEIADDFLRTREWVALPGTDYYREHLVQIQAAAERLHQSIRQPPNDAIWYLASRVRREMGMELRQTSCTVEGKLLNPVGFEALLVQFIKICKASSITGGPRGPRPREDLVRAAAGLADLWTKLSGQRFPKTFYILQHAQGITNPEEPEFKSPGPEFVRKLLLGFDDSLTFAEIRTALKQMPVKPSAIQGKP
jgi:hypothetical protein